MAFDATNKQHRKWFKEFQDLRTWGHCPVEFWVPHNYGNVASMCELLLTEYYLKSEFKFRKK